MKKTLSLFSLALLCLNVNAQQDEESKRKKQAAIAEKFPSTRTFDMQFLQYQPTDFKTERLGEDFQEGKIQSYSKFRVGINIPVIERKKWNLTSSFFYQRDAFTLENVINKAAIAQPVQEIKKDYQTLSGALSFVYFSELFGKPFIYNSTVNVDGTQKGAQRVKGFIGASLVIKRSPQTVMAVGGIFIIDPTSPIPIAPIFSLEHKFKGSAWVMDMILPQRLLFHRGMFENGRISVGSELAGDNFYVHNSAAGYAPVYTVTQMEVSSGITYEHSINKLIFRAKTGFSNPLQNRLTEKGKPIGDYIMKLKPEGSMYFGFGVSYNLFKLK